ncbi:MAG: hypothetical protein [Caudoviricetes sp.]|nr:MAG: hypothetical protein [Caudoviricetes sp.]
MLFDIRKVNCKDRCACEENENWLIPKSSLDKITNPSPNHAYILPSNDVYILGYNNDLIKIYEEGDAKELIDDKIKSLNKTWSSQKIAGLLAEIKSNERRLMNRYSPISPSFCFIDDDCRLDTFDVLKPIFDKRGVKFTAAAITDKVGDGRHLTIEQLQQLQSEGFEIASHTKTHPHLNGLDKAELIEELKGSKDTLESWGLNVNCLIYPYGERNDNVIKVTRDYYNSACSVAKENRNDRPILTYNIGRYGLGDDTTLDILKERVDYAIEKGNLCIFTTHIADTPKDIIPLIGEIIDYIISKGFIIETFGEAFEKQQNSLDYGDYTLYDKGDYFVVDSVGAVYSTFGKTKILEVGSKNFSSKINEFPQKCISTIFMRTIDNLSGSPEKNQAGVLTTIRLTNDNSGSLQEYTTISSNNRYYRFWDNSNNIWGEFKASHVGIYTIKDSNAFSKKFNEYDKYKIIYTKIFADNSSSPSGGGILITNTMIPEWQFCFQEFHPVGSTDILKRIVSNKDGEWGEFKKIGV